MTAYLCQPFLCLIVLCNLGLEPTVTWADPPKTFHAYMRGSVGYSNIFLSDSVLRKHELDRWVQLLNASEAQQAFLMRQYDEFVARHNEVMDEFAPRHLELSTEMSAVRTTHGSGSWELVDASDALARSSRALRRRLERVEHEFIDSLRPILTEEQLPRLMILHREATRRQCRLGRHRLRWADIELRDVWEQIDPELPSPTDAIAVETILEGYEVALTQATCRHADALISWSGRLIRYRAEKRHGEIDSAEFLNKHDRTNADLAAASRQIASLNVRTLQLIEREVSDELAGAIRQIAREAAFPEVYPDDTAIHDVFERLVRDDDLGEDTRKQVAALSRAYGTEYESSCERIETFCIEWAERSAAGVNGYQRQFLPDQLEPKLDERTELSCRYFEQLHELVGPDVLARHAEAIPAALRSQVGDLRTD